MARRKEVIEKESIQAKERSGQQRDYKKHKKGERLR